MPPGSSRGPGAEIDLYWEDLAPGRRFALGAHRVTEEEILAFGREFDPQPFHVDPERAQETVFGGLIASGWHSASVWMRLWVDAVLSHAASLGASGVEQLQWRRPVRPGDLLSGSAEVLSRRPSASRPERGWTQVRGELVDEGGEVKVSMVAWGLFGRRPAGPGS